KENWNNFLDELSSTPAGLLSFTSFDETELDLQNPVEQQNRQLSPLLNLVQIIAKRGVSLPIIVVTSSGISIDSKDSILNPQTGAIRGFLRTVGIEHPDIKTGIIDFKLGESVSGNLFGSAV